MSFLLTNRKHLHRHILSDNDLVTKSADPALVESFNSARTNLLYALSGAKDGKCIIVTSANVSEGKTTTGINLAVSLAQTEYKVLLVDADMRRPKMHTYLGVSNGKGLANLLGGFCELKEVVHSLPGWNLDYITAGEIPPNPTELLSSKKMEQFLEEVKKRYDIVLFDTPPVGVVADPMTLSALAENVVFVLKCRQSNIYEVDKALSALEFAKAKLLGFICIDSYKKTRKKKYTGYYYYHDSKTESEE